jgi:hypothetical protein
MAIDFGTADSIRLVVTRPSSPRQSECSDQLTALRNHPHPSWPSLKFTEIQWYRSVPDSLVEALSGI